MTECLKLYGERLTADAPEWLRAALERMPKGVKAAAYPGDRHTGWGLSRRFVEADSGADESSAGKPIFCCHSNSGIPSIPRRSHCGR